LDININGQAGRFVVHQAHPFNAQDVGDFVGVNEHGRCAVRNDRSGELGDSDHTALDVHVRVAQARNKIAVLGVDDLGIIANGVLGVGANIGDPAAADGYIGSGDDFTAVDVYPTAVPNHEIGRFTPHRDIN
jgi:hypothetical protein